MSRITKRTVDALKPGELVWDGELPGFGVRRQRTEARYYVFRYRFKGERHQYTIGRHGAPWTPQAARKEALRLMGEIAAGRNPAAVREAEKDAETIAAFAERFIRDYAEAHKRPRSVEEDRRNLKLHILPSLGRRKLAEVTRADVRRLHLSMRDTPIGANRVLALLSTMFAAAERWGVLPEGRPNPCRGVERFKEKKRERFLSEVELAKLGEALVTAERESAGTASAIAAIRLLMLTGGRRSEILTLRWEHVDFERGCLRLPMSKTDAKVIHLNPPALALLAALPRLAGNPHVIVGRREGGHLTDLERPWQRIRAAAGLPGVRLHDLRHSFASLGASAGLSLPMIGKLLGHTQAATTQRYAHLADDPQKRASELIGQRLAGALGLAADTTAQVVPLKRPG